MALCQLAERLQSVLPPNGLLARIGGDEFVALLPGDHEEAAALAVAKSFQDALEEPFPLGEFMIPMQASIGIALAPAHASTRSELLRCADVAMYRAKTQQTEVEIYKPTADVHTCDRLLLLSELRHAIDTGELALHYQPKVSLTAEPPAASAHGGRGRRVGLARASSEGVRMRPRAGLPSEQADPGARARRMAARAPVQPARRRCARALNCNRCRQATGPRRGSISRSHARYGVPGLKHAGRTGSR